MAILRPSSDLITGGWTSTDASLSAAIDESTYSDTDYIATSTAGQIARVSLGTYTTSVGTHSLKYRAASPEADRGLIARVLELGQPPALILKRDVWTSQPQTGGVQISAKYKTADMAIALPGACGAIGVTGSNRFYYSQSNASTEPRWTARGARLVADYAGGDDDRFSITTAMATAKYVPRTTIIVFDFLTTGSNLVNLLEYIGGHQLNHSSIGYQGNNGYKYVNTFSLTDEQRTGKRMVAVISTHNSARLLSTALWLNNTKVPMTGTQGNISYIGEGNIGATDTPYLGTADYTNYYHPNGTLALWATINGLYLPQSEVDNLAINPWQIFRKQSRPIFIDAPKVIATQTTTSGTIATSPTDYTLTLSSGEAASITNGATLALEVEST